MKTPCSYKTQGHPCPLGGHRTDIQCKCEEQRLKVCYHFLCAYHYERVQQHFKTPIEETAFFDAYCAQHGVTDPTRLWRVLRGELPPRPRNPYDICHIAEVLDDAIPAKGKVPAKGKR